MLFNWFFYPNFSYLINNIINSELSNLIDFSSLDMKKVVSNLKIPLAETISSLWDQGLKITQISDKLQIGRIAVRKYLQQAADMGLCDYDKNTSQYRGTRDIGKRKPVTCVTTGKQFESATAAERYYGIRHVSDCCNGKAKYAGKFQGQKLVWTYLTV